MTGARAASALACHVLRICISFSFFSLSFYACISLGFLAFWLKNHFNFLKHLHPTQRTPEHTTFHYISVLPVS